MTVEDKVIEEKLEEETFPDEEEVPDGEESDLKGTLVADGTFEVPSGVAVEELKNFSGHKKLKQECPEAVRELLTEKGLMNVYEQFVGAVAEESKTRGTFTGKWKDQEFISVLDTFTERFAEKGVKVALCKRKSGKGSFRWLEFIDKSKVPTYVPQFDVANRSGQVISTMYTKLKFPKGVAVEELKEWSGRKKLKEKMPAEVQTMMEEHDLMEEYEQLIDHCIEAGCGEKFKMWNVEKLKELLKVYEEKFSAKGVDLFVSHKQEYVSHGQYGGHMEYFRWIEFVDRAKQPNYMPQRDAESKDEQCVVS